MTQLVEQASELIGILAPSPTNAVISAEYAQRLPDEVLAQMTSPAGASR
jgi:hypothetical protein